MITNTETANITFADGTGIGYRQIGSASGLVVAHDGARVAA